MVPDTASVVVIGGGVIGASITYHLAKEGIDVLLVERGNLASGASGSCQGGIPVGLFSGSLLPLVVESARMHSRLSEEIGYDTEYEPRMLLVPALFGYQEELVQHHMAQLLSDLKQEGALPPGCSPRLELVDGRGAREIEPSLSNNVAAAITEEGLSATVNPMQLVFGFVKAAVGLGARVRIFEEVLGIERYGAKVAGVQTKHGRISTPCVVNAAGSWSPFIDRMAKIQEFPVKPQRGQIVVTETADVSCRPMLVESDYLLTAFRHDLIAGAVSKETEYRLKSGVAVNMVPTRGSNWLIGTSRGFDGYTKDTDYRVLSSITKRLLEFIPGFACVSCCRTYAGLRPYSSDDIPIVGKSKQLDGYYVATGHAGEGVSLSPLTGRLIADIVCGRDTQGAFLNLLSPARFEE